MLGRLLGRGGVTMAACAAALAFAGDEARATTFCVPAFSTACPANGTNLAEPILEKAMGLNATDGVADQIVVAAGTVVENGAFEPAGGFEDPASFEPAGSDPLTVIGAGAGSTVLTATGGGNIYLVNLSNSGNSRNVTIRDLTIQVPASFPDGLGAAILLYDGDRLEDVEVTSANKGSDGVSASGAGNVARGVEMRGSGAVGQVDDGFNVGSPASALTVEDSLLEGTSWALGVAGTGASMIARRVTEKGTRNYGAIASEGSITVENSVFGLNDGIGLYASAGTQDTSVVGDHLTVVNSGGTGPALEGKKFSSNAGDASIHVANSIFTGFGSGYKIESAIGPGIGVVTVAARYSNIPGNGTDMSGTVAFGPGNIDVNPLLAADFSLPLGSPSIDAGDPGIGLATDFLGAPRPVDGNGDSIAVRDQGAFEYQPPGLPACCDPPPPPCCGQAGQSQGGGGQGGGAGPSGVGASRDSTAPQTKILAGPGAKLADGKAKFRLSASEAGSTFQCKLSGGGLTAKAKPCTSPKRYAGLAPGRYLFKAWATDGAGNKDATPAKRSFSVPTA